MLLTRLWSSVAGIALEDIIIDDDDRKVQKKTQLIPTPRVLASVPNKRRVEGGNPDDDDNNDDKKNDDKNNDDDNDDSNNNNDNDDDTDKTTPSPTVLDIKEPCTICNTDSLGVNTYAILPTNDGSIAYVLILYNLH